ncbi:hypothetical protein PAPHI01_0656 [Pancytospora philotis]|nr:hypothetical protein PAPHI01_0656 [Pancytospora philotis]
MDAVSEAQKLVQLREYDRACSLFPTDVRYLKRIAGELAACDEPATICWLSALLRVPFNLTKILSAAEVRGLAEFLLSKRRAAGKLGKIARANLALIIKSMMISGGYTALFATRDGRYFILDTAVEEDAFYSTFKQLAKVADPTELRQMVKSEALDMLELSESDSVMVQRYKLKIRSHSTCSATAADDAAYMLGRMNAEGQRLGWTLAKCLARLSRHLAEGELARWLLSAMQGDIFGNELLWMNALVAAGMLDLRGAAVPDWAFIHTALSFDEEFALRGAGIRENALSFLWCWLEAGGIAKLVCSNEIFAFGAVLRRVVFVALFDVDFGCRRFACSVIEATTLADAAHNEQWFGQSAEVLSEINPGTVKRLGSCVRTFKLLDRRELYEAHVSRMLYHYRREQRDAAARLIAECYDARAVEKRYDTPVEMDGYNLLVYYANQARGSADGYLRIEQPFECAAHLKCRNAELMIESYLHIFRYVEPVSLKKNVLLLISKYSQHADFISRIVHHFASDTDFCKAVAAYARRSSCGLAANARNAPFGEQFRAVCLDNLCKSKNVAATIAALTPHAEPNDMELASMVLAYIDDYSVDATGDAGYPARRAALFYAMKIGSALLETVVPRFLADKSKKLRDELVLALLSYGYAKHTADFGHLKGPGVCGIGGCKCKETDSIRGSLPRALEGALEIFFTAHSEFSVSMPHEQAYFSALFAAFKSNQHFAAGLINTVASADRALLGMLLQLINDHGCDLSDAVDSLIARRTIPLHAVLRFLALAHQAGITVGHVTPLASIDVAALTAAERRYYNLLMPGSNIA